MNATLHVGLVHVAEEGMPMYAKMALFSVFIAMGPLPLTFAYLLSMHGRILLVISPSRYYKIHLGIRFIRLPGGPVEGSTIAIHGLGPIGLFSVMVAKMMGAEKIMAVDWDNKFRMDLATRLEVQMLFLVRMMMSFIPFLNRLMEGC